MKTLEPDPTDKNARLIKDTDLNLLAINLYQNVTQTEGFEIAEVEKELRKLYLKGVTDANRIRKAMGPK